MLCRGDLDPHFPKRGDCVKKAEYYWSSRVDYMENFISVSLNQSKTIDLQSLRKLEILIHLKVLSMLLLIHQPLLKVALKMKTFSFNTMMKFTQQEPLQYFFRV